MAFDIVEMPSGSILIKGKLVQKKLTAKSKRLVMLCFPKTLEDVQVLFEHLTLTNKETGQLAGLSEEDQVNRHFALLACVAGKEKATHLSFIIICREKLQTRIWKYLDIFHWQRSLVFLNDYTSTRRL